MNTSTLIGKITKAICYTFKTDGTSPGLTTSWIHHTESFYVSIVRWVHGEKEVVCSASHADLNTALVTLAEKFLETVPVTKNPVESLGEFLSENKRDPLPQQIQVIQLDQLPNVTFHN